MIKSPLIKVVSNILTMAMYIALGVLVGIGCSDYLAEKKIFEMKVRFRIIRDAVTDALGCHPCASNTIEVVKAVETIGALKIDGGTY